MKEAVISDRIGKRFRKGIYMNREYSWLLFNKRVLEQSQDLTNPILERCRFISIFTSNLDEFFMVRVGSLWNEMLTSPDEKENKTDLTASEQLEGICDYVRKLYPIRTRYYSRLRKELSLHGIKIMTDTDLTGRQKEICERIFTDSVLPLLSPLVLDAKHPLMQFENKQEYMLYELEKEGRRMVGVMKVHPGLDRIYRIGEGKKVRLMPLEEMIRAFGDKAFTGYDVKDKLYLRVTRNADFDTQIDDTDLEHDYPEQMKQKVDSRATQCAVRLETDREDSKLLEFAKKLLHLPSKFCFVSPNFFRYNFLGNLAGYIPDEQKADMLYKPFSGAEVFTGSSVIDEIFRHDLFLSYPYDSMSTLVKLLEECTVDDRVQSVQITIYRLASHSRIAELLCKASENGKQVTVVIELSARFDEENNMYFADKLKNAGCTIIYGMGNYKVHSKILSVVLKEKDNIKYITHLGTGNYNESTSKQYTDLNILTSDRLIGEDAVAFFQNIAIANTDFSYERLLVAPKTLKSGIIELIDEETEKAKRGQNAVILAKMNSLTDKEMIDKFAEASEAGVQITLIVRGICCLVPGIEGKTDNIKIISIVGRFLEHSRVYVFGEGSERKMYISSADLMTRNVSKRVEIAAPVLDAEIADRIYDDLQTMLTDNVKASKLCSDGKYRRVETLGEMVDAQQQFIIEATEEAAL